MKMNKYLVVYDYTSGGVWALVAATSEDEIIEKAPKLRVVKGQPVWMTNEIYHQIEEKMSFDINHPSGWLAELIGS